MPRAAPVTSATLPASRNRSLMRSRLYHHPRGEPKTANAHYSAEKLDDGASDFRRLLLMHSRSRWRLESARSLKEGGRKEDEHGLDGRADSPVAPRQHGAQREAQGNQQEGPELVPPPAS